MRAISLCVLSYVSRFTVSDDDINSIFAQSLGVTILLYYYDKINIGTDLLP